MLHCGTRTACDGCEISRSEAPQATKDQMSEAAFTAVSTSLTLQDIPQIGIPVVGQIFEELGQEAGVTHELVVASMMSAARVRTGECEPKEDKFLNRMIKKLIG